MTGKLLCPACSVMDSTLVSGKGWRPTFGLRTLCKALRISVRNSCGRFKRSRSLLETFSLAHPAILGLELCMILEQRCILPHSYSQRMIKVLGELQNYRRGSVTFTGKEGFIALGDLFRSVMVGFFDF